ncbi:Uncharacterized protein PBTT_08444 [Plasmodiophora brassicae]
MAVGDVDDRTEGDERTFEDYERAGQHARRLASEVKSLSTGDQRKRDMQIAACMPRYRKALKEQSGEHWDVKHELEVTLARATRMTDLSQQTIDNRIVMEIATSGQSIVNAMRHAERRCQRVATLQAQVARRGLRSVVEHGTHQDLNDLKRRQMGMIRSLEKQIQLSQRQASVANTQSRALRDRVRGDACELTAQRAAFDDLTRQVLERQRRIVEALAPIHEVEATKAQSRAVLRDLEERAAQDRRELARQHADLLLAPPEVIMKDVDAAVAAAAVDRQRTNAVTDLMDEFLGNLRGRRNATHNDDIASVDAQLDVLEFRLLRGSWGIASLKASLAATRTRLVKVRDWAARLQEQTRVNDLSVLEARFADAQENAMTLYRELGDLRDELAELQKNEGGQVADDTVAATGVAKHRARLQEGIRDCLDKTRRDDGVKKAQRQTMDALCDGVHAMVRALFPADRKTLSVTDSTVMGELSRIESHVGAVLHGHPSLPRPTTLTLSGHKMLNRVNSKSTNRHQRANTFMMGGSTTSTDDVRKHLRSDSS